jgi:hypothetical protein
MPDAYDQAIANYTAAQQPQESPTTEQTTEPVATESTEEQSIQSAETPVPAKTEEQPEAPNWNPQQYVFKADGKNVTPKNLKELLDYASQGYHYSIRAQKLNQREADLYAREQALKNQPQPQQSVEQQEQEEFNPFAATKDPQVAKLEQELAQLKEQVGSFTQKQNAVDATQYATQVEDFASSLTTDFGLSKEMVDEFIWDAMQVADKFDDIDDLKAYFFKTHPDAPENRAKILAEQDIAKFKSKMSRNTVVNGTNVGNTPTTKKPITNYEDAYKAAASDPRLSDIRGVR